MVRSLLVTLFNVLICDNEYSIMLLFVQGQKEHTLVSLISDKERLEIICLRPISMPLGLFVRFDMKILNQTVPNYY